MAKHPKQIGFYTIQGVLGHGGMATVYRARDQRSGRIVALKALPLGYMEQGSLVRRFLLERKVVERLTHPNVVKVFDTGQADNYYYIAMELAPGGTLADQLQKYRSLDNQKITNIIGQVAAGLDFAHSQGLVHRDVKPSNIMFTRDGRVILTDFGIVKDLNSDQSRITVIGTSIGTPAYMSPEQARAEDRLDRRSDIYSLGVVTYHMLTGRVPFQATSHAEMINLIATQQPPPAKKLNPQVSAVASQVLERVLAQNPQQRFPSAGRFAYDLAQALGGVSRSAPNVRSTQQPGLHQTTVPLSSKERKDRKSLVRGGSAKWSGRVSLIGGTVLAVGALLWILAGVLGIRLPRETGMAPRPGTGTKIATAIVANAGIGDGAVEDEIPSLLPHGDGQEGSPRVAEPSDTPTVLPIATRTVAKIVVPTATQTATQTREPTRVPTPLPTSLPSPLPMDTPLPTSAPTMTATPTPTKLSSHTPTATPTSSSGSSQNGPTPTPTPLFLGGGGRANPTVGPTRRPTSTPFVTPTPVATATPTRTPTRPPATSAPTRQPAAPTATAQSQRSGTSSEEIRQLFVNELNRSSVRLDYPYEAERFVTNLAAHIEDFNLGNVSATVAAQLLSQSGAGDRTKAVVQNVWVDWLSFAGSSSYSRVPGSELTPFRRLVVRFIQGSQGTLSYTDQGAIISYYTRTEDPNVWFGNIDGVIGAINREIY